MTRIPIISALMGLAACAGEPFQAELAECRCLVEGCGPDDCQLRIEFDPNCAGEFDFAEVYFDGHIEDELARPGESFLGCSRIPFGGSSLVAVRGGDWIWGLLEEGCTEAGQTRRLRLQCTEVEEPPLFPVPPPARGE